MGILNRIKEYLAPRPALGDAFMRQQSVMVDVWAAKMDREIIGEVVVHGAVKKLIENPVAYYGIFCYLDEDGYIQCQLIKNNHVWGLK